MNRGMNVISPGLLRRRRIFWPTTPRLGAATRVLMRINITFYAPETRAHIGARGKGRALSVPRAERRWEGGGGLNGGGVRIGMWAGQRSPASP